MVEARENPTAAVTLTAYSPDVLVAEQAFSALVAAGVEPADVNVLARGAKVDRLLIKADEINANLRVSGIEEGAPLSALARKFASERRFLLEGCWGAGPVFLELADRSGRQGEEFLTRTLVRSGVCLKEAAGIESTLKKEGGVWLAARVDPSRADEVERALEAVAGARVKRLGGVAGS